MKQPVEGKPGRYWHASRMAESSVTSAPAIASCMKGSAASFRLIGSFDDFGFETRQDLRERVAKNRALIGAVGEQLRDEWKLTEQRRQEHDAAIAILNAGGMNDGVQQQTQRVDDNMPLLALDQVARIEPVRIDAGPPFSALLTLWLSMMQAVGLASRSAFSRHSA